MHNSATINLNMVDLCSRVGVQKVFYSSSACIYPEYNQRDPSNPKCNEESAYPAAPDSEYGWEKLFSERMYMAYHRNRGLDVRIARFHNIFGSEGSWNNGKEKAPAAFCRKVAETPNRGDIEVWGDGEQTRSFLYIDECLEAVRRLMDSDFLGPVNIGSEEMIAINDLARMVIDISGKNIGIRNIPGPTGVRGRNSDNRLLGQKLGWKPCGALREGMEKTYAWIEEQVRQSAKPAIQAGSPASQRG
jgi:nucleoside-diphosphate-sugar epimerase